MTASHDVMAERSGPETGVTTGWIDAARRTHTWVLQEPSGVYLAEITIKRDVQKLADLLNRATSAGCGHSR